MSKTPNIISFELLSLKNFQDFELAKNVLKTINAAGKDFIPEKYDYYEPLKNKYDVEDIEKVAKIWFNEEANKVAAQNNFAGSILLMQKKKSPKTSYIVSWEKTNKPFPNLFAFSIDIGYFKGQQQLQAFLDLCVELTRLIESVYGSITNNSFPGGHEPLDLQKRLPELHWKTILGEPYIKMFGKEVLFNTPCYSVREINDKTIFLQSTDDLFQPIPQDVRANIKNYLGADSFTWDGKNYGHYKTGKAPELDFSEVVFDKTKPIVEPGIVRQKK